jgi:hypothetical protein
MTLKPLHIERAMFLFVALALAGVVMSLFGCASPTAPSSPPCVIWNPAQGTTVGYQVCPVPPRR